MIAHKGFFVELGFCNFSSELSTFLPLPDVLLQPILYGIFCIGISQSEFIRQAVFTAKVNVTVQPVFQSDTLDEIAAQYGKIGSNLNQIAHYLNGGNPMQAHLLRDINHCLADLQSLKQQIEKLAGES